MLRVRFCRMRPQGGLPSAPTPSAGEGQGGRNLKPSLSLLCSQRRGLVAANLRHRLRAAQEAAAGLEKGQNGSLRETKSALCRGRSAPGSGPLALWICSRRAISPSAGHGSCAVACRCRMRPGSPPPRFPRSLPTGPGHGSAACNAQLLPLREVFRPLCHGCERHRRLHRAASGPRASAGTRRGIASFKDVPLHWAEVRRHYRNLASASDRLEAMTWCVLVTSCVGFVKLPGGDTMRVEDEFRSQHKAGKS